MNPQKVAFSATSAFCIRNTLSTRKFTFPCKVNILTPNHLFCVKYDFSWIRVARNIENVLELYMFSHSGNTRTQLSPKTHFYTKMSTISQKIPILHKKCYLTWKLTLGVQELNMSKYARLRIPGPEEEEEEEEEITFSENPIILSFNVVPWPQYCKYDKFYKGISMW